MVIVIIVLGIVGALGLTFIRYTVEGYDAQTGRAALVDDTTIALSRMARDIRAALPNSVRIKDGGNTIEMIHVVAAARYRDGPGPSHGSPDATLEFNQADEQFNVLPRLPEPSTLIGTRAVIYNIGIAGADAYENANVITSSEVKSVSDEGSETGIKLSGPFQFQYRSPAQRIYFVDGAIAWTCDSGALTRYSDYPIGDPPADGALAAQDVAKCDFQYTAGTAQRAGVATLSLTLTDADGESAHLLEQVHVVNAP
jgi:MSHA biogenesis protein MshO